MKYLLGIDVGTSGTKTVLFDTQGNIIGSKMVAYPLYTPQNGWAEQDPNDWWAATKESIQAVLQCSGIQTREIVGVGISGQMHGLVMLDQEGNVIRHAIIWCDQRTGKECEQINELVGHKRHIELAANPPLTGFTAPKILWVRTHEPFNYAKCKQILLPKDFIRYKLTGVFATEVSDASGTGLLDVRRRCWSEELLDKLSIDRDLLPKVYESPEITGVITAEGASATGLCEGTIVVGGAGDNAAAAIGTGVVGDGKAFTTIGTSGVVYAHTSQMTIDPKGRIHTFCCAVPGAWHVMGVTQAAGLSLRWFKDTCCSELLAEATRQQIDVYDLMSEWADQAPIGANKLLYLPYLNGERTPHLDPECRGVFFGLSTSHTKKDLIRAVMEGVTYSLRDCLEVMREMGYQVQDMTACGGGGKSQVWRQMLSDVLECKVQTVVSEEGPALGVAILAGVGAGIFPSVEEGCNALVTMREPVVPRQPTSQTYHAYYRIYKGLYKPLKESFHELAQL